MSWSETKQERDPQLESAVEVACAAVEQALAKGATEAIPDEVVQRFVAAGIRLFARKVDQEERFFAPFPEDATVTPTDVVMIVPEMLRAADLSAFDLALWLQRPR